VNVAPKIAVVLAYFSVEEPTEIDTRGLGTAPNPGYGV